VIRNVDVSIPVQAELVEALLLPFDRLRANGSTQGERFKHDLAGSITSPL